MILVSQTPMYLPEAFAETRPDFLAEFIRQHPLGVLVTHDAQGLDANHLPFEFDPAAGSHGVLTAHVARANPVWQRCQPSADVLVVFRGAAGYISPNWYPTKHETHTEVPTWNYEVVHAHGILTVQDDERFVRGVVARLTRHHEATQPRPWKMGDSPPAFISDKLRAIVGIEIAVTSLVGKRKLGQNKQVRDRLGAADGLDASGEAALARAMRDAD